MLYNSVVPFATMPAMIKAAPALKSEAYTGAPLKVSTPSKTADLPCSCDSCAHFI